MPTLDVAANVAEDRPSANKEVKEINPLKIIHESVTEHCGIHSDKWIGIGD
tara:strand:- start:507 stop:659 length:153 start_codon:yes stop_codon:yes gene_type:complete